MRVAGALMLLGSAGCGVWLALQNSGITVQARVGRAVWTGHLYMVLVFGALLAAWFCSASLFCWVVADLRTAAQAGRHGEPQRHVTGRSHRLPTTCAAIRPRMCGKDSGPRPGEMRRGFS
jgi:hypothetical protein